MRGSYLKWSFCTPPAKEVQNTEEWKADLILPFACCATVATKSPTQFNKINLDTALCSSNRSLSPLVNTLQPKHIWQLQAHHHHIWAFWMTKLIAKRSNFSLKCRRQKRPYRALAWQWDPACYCFPWAEAERLLPCVEGKTPGNPTPSKWLR